MNSSNKPLILVVEDEPINREVLVDTLLESNYTVLTAGTGDEASQIIETYRGKLDAILLDRLLPDLDTITLLVKLKSDPVLKHVPVIIQTSLSSDTDIADGLRAGAYYYLTKPFPPDTLLAIVRAAIKDRREYLELQHSLLQTHGILRHLRLAEFTFKTQSQARDLAALTAHVAPDPERVVLGLTELMLNAIEHGNLAISYDEKSSLISNNQLEAEVGHRLQLPEYAEREAVLRIERVSDSISFHIRDEGRGFDWLPYLEMSPARAFDTHGRGIAMSNLLSFDELNYLGCGNEVIGRIKV